LLISIKTPDIEIRRIEETFVWREAEVIALQAIATQEVVILVEVGGGILFSHAMDQEGS
jgi:hypothetical protein